MFSRWKNVVLSWLERDGGNGWFCTGVETSVNGSGNTVGKLDQDSERIDAMDAVASRVFFLHECFGREENAFDTACKLGAEGVTHIEVFGIVSGLLDGQRCMQSFP